MKRLIVIIAYLLACALWLTAYIAGVTFGLSKQSRARVVRVLFAPVRWVNWIVDNKGEK